MVEPEERFPNPEDLELRRRAEQRCLEAEQRCFRAERRRFEAERQRDQLQTLLAEARRAGLRMGEVVQELRRLVASLRDLAERPAGFLATEAAVDLTAADSQGRGEASHAPGVDPPSAAPGDAMVEALSAAIARLRANVLAVGEPGDTPTGDIAGAPIGDSTSESELGRATPSAQPTERADHARARVVAWREATLGQSAIKPVHKHSLSWIARWRRRRKQRRS